MTMTKARTPSAIEDMQKELNKILAAQTHCIDKWGIVKTHMRNEYLTLTKQAKTIRDSIEWMQKLYNKE